jgi:hypothetical protein
VLLFIVDFENVQLIVPIINVFIKLHMRKKLYCDVKNRTGLAVEVVAAVAVAVDRGVSMCRQGNFWAEPTRSWYCC